VCNPCGGSGNDAGMPADGGGTVGGDSGTDGNGGAGDAGGGGGGSCAEFGQLCQTNADCCTGIPCTNGRCEFPTL
jgi:hypothetical protein